MPTSRKPCDDALTAEIGIENPVEDVWNQSKYGALANVIPDDIHDLHSALDQVLETFRHEPSRLHSFFDTAHLTL